MNKNLFKGLFYVLALLCASLLLNTTSMAATNVIKLGAINPLSGPAGMFGTIGARAQIRAIKQINKKGGIDVGGIKYKLKYIEYDSAGRNDRARTAAERLAAVDKVAIVINSWRSSGALAIMPVAEKYKIPMFTSGITPRVNFKGTYIFRANPTTVMDSYPLLKYLYEKTKLRKIGILAEDGPWGNDTIKLIKWWTAKFGGSYKILGRFPFGEQDFHALIAKAKLAVEKKEVDVIYVQTWGTAMELFIRQAAKTGLSREVQLASGIGAGDYISVKSVTPQMKGWIIEPLYGMFAYINNPEIRKYFSPESFKIFDEYKKLGLPIGGPGMVSYTNLMVAIAAIEKAGSTDPQKIREALAGLTVETMLGKLIYNNYGQPSFKMNVVRMILKNGKLVPKILEREFVPAIVSLPPKEKISIKVLKW